MTFKSISRRGFVHEAALTGLTLPLVSKKSFASNNPDVLVIGAGLSGLHAALTLEEQGLTVQVIEGRNRIGGRVLTLSDIPGNPEAGASGMGPNYARVMDTAEKYGVELINAGKLTPLTNNQESSFMMQRELVLGNEVISPVEWLDHRRNVLPEEYRHLMPWRFVPTFINKDMPLKSHEDWFDPASASLDISLHDYLVSKNVPEEVIQLTYNINAAFGNSAYDISALMLMFAYSWEALARAIEPGSAYFARGGNRKIPEAMANALKREVHLNKKVEGIRNNKDNVQVVCEDGSVYSARRVICSVPFPVLRSIHVDPIFKGVQGRAVQTIGVQQVTQTHIVPTAPFWEEDGIAPSMFTDSIAGNVIAFYSGPPFPTKENPELSSIVAWHRGFTARQLDQLPVADAKRAVVKAIEDIRPAAKGKIEVAGFKSWHNDPFSCGDWSVWEPGQITAFIKDMSKPHHRTHFCGEHTAVSSRGMEAAMESAERAALEVLDVI